MGLLDCAGGTGARALHAACMVRLSLFFGKAGKKTYILFVFRREQSSCLEKAKAQRAISEFLRGAPYPPFFPAAESGWTAPISSAPLRSWHDRSNGLGGGFAGYGIYPEYAEQYAFHVFYNNVKAKEECEKFINEHFDVVNLSKIPSARFRQITDEPLIWRYFVTPLHTKLAESRSMKTSSPPAASTASIPLSMARIFSPAAKTWACLRPSATRRMSVGSIVSMNTLATVGRRTAATRRIPPAGGAVRTVCAARPFRCP